jgi:hypothetical protein
VNFTSSFFSSTTCGLNKARDEDADDLHEKTGLSVQERYGTTAKDIYWFGFPLFDVNSENTEYTQYWPKTTEFLKEIPGLINVCVNFVGPNSRIPDHADIDILPEKIGNRTAIGTIIGISMPSSDPSIVGFHVNNEIKGWNTGDIVSINGYEIHGGWNKSNDWRVSLLIDTDKVNWDL